MDGVFRTFEDFTTWGGGVDIGYEGSLTKPCEHCGGFGYLLRVGDDDFFDPMRYSAGDKVVLDGEEFEIEKVECLCCCGSGMVEY